MVRMELKLNEKIEDKIRTLSKFVIFCMIFIWCKSGMSSPAPGRANVLQSLSLVCSNTP